MSCADFAASEPELALGLEERPTVQLDSLTTGRQLLAPKDLLQLDGQAAVQLRRVAWRLACTDLTHYLTSRLSGAGAVRRRGPGQEPAAAAGGAEDPRRAGPDRGDMPPEKGTVLIAVGALSAGMRISGGAAGGADGGAADRAPSGRSKKPRPKRDSNQQKLQSYTDLTPGDLVVHAHHGIGRFVGMQRLPVDGVEKDYIKIAYAGQRRACMSRPRQLDLVSKYIGGGEDTRAHQAQQAGGHRVGQDSTRRAKAAAKDLAKGLIQLYAQRQRLAGLCLLPGLPLAAGV